MANQTFRRAPSPHGSFDDLRVKFMDISDQDKKRAELIEVLLDRSALTAHEIHRLSMDLEDQTRSRSEYQEEVRLLKEQIKGFKRLLQNDAYVVILIDGDGAKFLDHFLRNPSNGAAEAAQKLVRHIRDYLKDTLLSLDGTSILARVFANIKGLARSLHVSGAISSEDDMYTFAENFTNSRADFDFVNVGQGKENADSKMRRMLKYFFTDCRCKKIFFVACHDSGYVHELREYAGDPEAEERIVLVETTPAHPAFSRSLSFPMVRFEDVFSDKVPRYQSKTPLIKQTCDNTDTLARSISDPNEGSIAKGSNKKPEYSEVLIEHPTSHSPHPGQNHDMDNATPTRKLNQTKTIKFNALGNRLDPPIKAPAHTIAHETYKQKCKEVKPKLLCNSFYINGRCPWKDKCDKMHDIQLSAEEVAIRRYKARTSMCGNGPGCSNFDCCHGHHCPDPECNRQDCKFKQTKFGDMHLEKMNLEPMTEWTKNLRNKQHSGSVKRSTVSQSVAEDG